MNLITSNQLTMSTREIASMLGKNNSDIKRSALRLEQKGLLTQPLAEFDYDHKGNVYNEYRLNKRDSILLVAQNSPEFTAAIVDRWQELENQLPKIPTNFAEALQLAADQAKQLELAAPKVAFVDNLVTRNNLMTATQVGAKHKMSAVKINKFLDELGGVYSRAVKRGRVFVQPFIDKGYGELKQTELGYAQALFTPAGEVWIHQQLISEGAL
jgi:phage regulator Rha-like protein